MAELDALRAKAKFDAKKYNVALANVREELQDEFEAWQATTSGNEATFVTLRV